MLMPPAELKLLLHLARRQALSCTIAMTKDKQGLILLHRRTKPRKLAAELRQKAKSAGLELDPTSVRFGRATVDGGSDSAMVTFTVNKPAPGPMRRALLEQVRPASFQRCEIVVDESLEGEAEDDSGEEGKGPPADHAAGQARAEHGQPNAVPVPTVTGDTPPAVSPNIVEGIRPAATATGTAPGVSQGAASRDAPDTKVLTDRLASVARRMAAMPKLGPAATGTATAAVHATEGALQSGDLAKAERLTGKLERLLAIMDSVAPAARVISEGGQDHGQPREVAPGGDKEITGAGDGNVDGMRPGGASPRADAQGAVQDAPAAITTPSDDTAATPAVFRSGSARTGTGDQNARDPNVTQVAAADSEAVVGGAILLFLIWLATRGSDSPPRPRTSRPPSAVPPVVQSTPGNGDEPRRPPPQASASGQTGSPVGPHGPDDEGPGGRQPREAQPPGAAARKLTAEELGLRGNIQQLDIDFSVQDRVATARINMIEGNFGDGNRFVMNLMRLARANGAATLEIRATVANERIMDLMMGRGAFNEGTVTVLRIPVR